MALEALIFDVDGTLADTERAHLDSFNAAFDALGLGWQWQPEQYRGLLQVTGGKERLAAFVDGLPVAAAERSRLAALIPAIHAEKTRRYTAVVTGGAVPLRDGVERLIGDARRAGLRLAIATTTTAANIDALLTATLGDGGPAMFDVIASGDSVAAKKPAPDVYQLALRTLGVEADHAVAFEDSRHGLRAAVDAGLWTVVTPTFWTEAQDFSGAGLLLPSLAGLTLEALTREHRRATTPSNRVLT